MVTFVDVSFVLTDERTHRDWSESCIRNRHGRGCCQTHDVIVLLIHQTSITITIKTKT